MLVCPAAMHEGPDQPTSAVVETVLGNHVRTALAAPGELPAEASAAACQALAGAGPGDPGAVPYGLLAAIAYARPELLPPDLVAVLGQRLAPGVLSASELPRLVAAFTHLAHTPLAAPALRCLLDAARRGALYVALGGEAVELLATFAAHHPELWSAADVAEALPSRTDLRELYVGNVLEPLLIRAPSWLAAPLVQSLSSTLADSARWRRALALLAGRQTPPADRRAAAPPWCRREDTARLRREPFHLVALVNVRFGLGDELIRVGPLVQALLDVNPRASVTILTPRPFLYDHPRVTAVALGDARAPEVLAQPADGRFVIHEPVARHVVLRPELEELAQALESHCWLLLRGDVNRGYFLLQRVRVGSTELAADRGLDRVDLPRVYDPMRRLLLELGLPVRCGEERPAASFLTGDPSACSRRLWRELVSGSRRAAVVNPFGGAHRVKGYLREQAAEIAGGLASLVHEGYRVVLLPNGEAWSSREIVREILDRLPPATRTEVAVAPDPAVEDPHLASRLAERAELSWADRATRVHKFFIGYADLVVAVEGWVGHLAYQLGQPFRLLLRTDSDTSRWHPPWRGEHQVLATDLALLGPPPGADALDGVATVAPSLPRKAMLFSALAALRQIGGEPALRLLRRAATSPDERTRSLALRAMADVARGHASAPEVAAEICDHLADPRARLRGAAAEALLSLGVDLSAKLGPRHAALLHAYAAIGHQRWAEVIELGTAALPALARALDDQDGMFRAEGKWATSMLLRRLAVPALQRRGL